MDWMIAFIMQIAVSVGRLTGLQAYWLKAYYGSVNGVVNFY